MSSAVLRVVLVGLGFAAGLGVALAIRQQPPPDLSSPRCPDCGSAPGRPITYSDGPDGRLRVAAGGPPLDPFDPGAARPRFYCPRCRAAWGPPDYHRPGGR
jgi:hypothetical protein